MDKRSKVVPARIAAETQRMDQIRAAASKPFGAGSQIVDVAPARGAVAAFHPRQTVITDAGKVRVERTGHNGQMALRRVSAMEVMEQQAQRRASKDSPYRPMFTTAQHNTASAYAAIYERYHAAGVRCSSVEALGGGGDPDGYLTGLLDLGARYRAMKGAAIGGRVPVIVLQPRGALAHADRGRSPIHALGIVDDVCVAGLTVASILAKYGWSRAPSYRLAIMEGFKSALDRMQPHAP